MNKPRPPKGYRIIKHGEHTEEGYLYFVGNKQWRRGKYLGMRIGDLVGAVVQSNSAQRKKDIKMTDTTLPDRLRDLERENLTMREHVRDNWMLAVKTKDELSKCEYELDALRAELDALRPRRCDGCKYNRGEYDGYVNCNNEKFSQGDSGLAIKTALWFSRDHYCSSWAKREAT